MASREFIAPASPGPESFQPRPVFILGIAERSGTTYLQDLLRVHPDCDVDGLELEEDRFLTYADLLVKYVDSASRLWKLRDEETGQKERDLVCRCLGDGLISYLRLEVRNRRVLAGIAENKPLKVLVTKTPNVRNLELFFKFFPEADVIVLMRDGRAVVESAVRTFYRSFEQDTRNWATRAESILRFDKANANSGLRYMIVRYEDLYTKTEEEMRRVMSFLRLDPAIYDFGRAHNLPVRGSSTFGREGAEWEVSFLAPGIHWNPVPKTSDFHPLQRWSGWKRPQHERFNWIAGRYLSPFGYAIKTYSGYRWLWTAWNRILDTFPIEKWAYLFRKAYREWKFASSNRTKALRHLFGKVTAFYLRSKADQHELS